jgi:hypothetical protein
MWLIILAAILLTASVVTGVVIYLNTNAKTWQKHTLLPNEGGHVDISGTRLILSTESTKTTKMYHVEEATYVMTSDLPFATVNKSSETEVKFGYKAVSNGTNYWAAAVDLNKATAKVILYENEEPKYTYTNKVDNISLFGYGLKYIDNFLFVGDPKDDSWYIYNTTDGVLNPVATQADLVGVGRCIDVIKSADDQYTVAVSNTTEQKILIYTFSGSSTEVTPVCTITNTGHGFGTDLKMSLDGTRLVTGSIGVDEVYVYDLDLEAKTLTQVGNTITGDIGIDGEVGYFGVKVSISHDGSTIAAAAPKWTSDVGTHNSDGYVKVFDWDGDDWKQRGSTINGSSSGEEYGQTMILNGDGGTLVVGGFNTVDRWVWTS